MTRRCSTASVPSLTSTIPTNSRNAPPSISKVLPFSIFTSRSSSSCSDRCGLGADTTRSGDLLRWQQHVYSTPARATRTEQVVARRGLAKLRCWQPVYCAPGRFRGGSCCLKTSPRRPTRTPNWRHHITEQQTGVRLHHPPAQQLYPVPGAVDRDCMRDRVATCP